MNKSKALNILLSAALLILVAKIAMTPRNNMQEQQNESSSAVINNIMTRTSIRAYQKKPVEDAKIEQLLKAAMASPTAANKQPWFFVVIKSPELLNALADILPHAQMTAKAPLAIVACGDLNKALDGNGQDFWIQDVSAASENLLLAAHAIGLGAVWTGVYPDKERTDAAKKLLKLPQNIIPLNVIPIGYPAESPSPKEKWNKSNVNYL